MGRKHTQRHITRRKLEQCANLCDNINTHLSEIAPHYEERYPYPYNVMLEIGRIVDEARKLLLDLRNNI